ncbi:hypothetical protein GH714_010683 [Hevea brasiliensis]|uniref:NAC domain-containing protein n=1 Tax=Hevea brasiliensis TaxID=3981 RepID=A0A6A6LI54_HEVBR|nr:hypothetical protein GH714_010683 [Hevea brasiliensis]
MLPHGFKYSPTDEELIELLNQKASGHDLPLLFFSYKNVYEYEPQDLECGDLNLNLDVSRNESYYYYKKENDSREVFGRGWWKATSHVKKIQVKEIVGCKRPLTFHRHGDFARSNIREKEVSRKLWRIGGEIA